MRSQAEIERDREKDEALMRKWDELGEKAHRICMGHAYLRGYYDGLLGKIVTLPRRERDAE